MHCPAGLPSRKVGGQTRSGSAEDSPWETTLGGWPKRAGPARMVPAPPHPLVGVAHSCCPPAGFGWALRGVLVLAVHDFKPPRPWAPALTRLPAAAGARVVRPLNSPRLPLQPPPVMRSALPLLLFSLVALCGRGEFSSGKEGGTPGSARARLDLPQVGGKGGCPAPRGVARDCPGRMGAWAGLSPLTGAGAGQDEWVCDVWGGDRLSSARPPGPPSIWSAFGLGSGAEWYPLDRQLCSIPALL